MHDRDQDALAAYRERIAYLRRMGEADGYGVNRRSELDFRRFVEFVPDFRRGDLVLSDEGNLRVGWEDERGSYLGLLFLGGGLVQYVIFVRRAGESRTTRVAGRDSFEGIVRRVEAHELESMVRE